MKLGAFLLGLAQGGRIAKAFGHGLASYSPREPEPGILAGIVSQELFQDLGAFRL